MCVAEEVTVSYSFSHKIHVSLSPPCGQTLKFCNVHSPRDSGTKGVSVVS